MSLQVVTVRSKDEREQFLRLPWKLYDGRASWVPNLLILQREVIDTKKNPFFEHGEAQLFLALRDGEPVGRISASIDHDHNRYHSEQTGFFGFFEAVEECEVAGALLGSAESWLRERGMARARGPFSFSLNEEAGLQVDGFDEQAMIAMPQALSYYGALVESAGYAKAMDLLAYRWDMQQPPDRMREAIARTRAFEGLAVRTVRMRHLKQEVNVLLDIYNDTWHENWGYVPVTRREAAKLVSDLRLVADRRIVLIAEINGEPAGMVVGLPNLYEAIHDFNGLVDPLKAIKLLWRLKARGTRTGRIFLFGVKKKFRTRELVGLPFLLLDELYQAGEKARYVWCEQSWVLENNARLNAIMPHWGAFVYKRYRVYEKAL
jgi:hypothetical protein